jgi:CRISPR-associated Csx2 family protein
MVAGKMIIGALGAPRDGKYARTTYHFHNTSDSLSTPYFLAALARQINPDRVLVLLTPRAKVAQERAAQEGLSLADELQRLGQPAPEFIAISDGAKDTELWEIVQALDPYIPEGAEIYADVTYGFRSIPLILLSALAYFRQARGIVIQDVCYGAFEAAEGDPKPVFSLIFFATLLDWSQAVQTFKHTGDCSLIAEMLGQHQLSLHRHGPDGKKRLTDSLAQAAQQLKQLAIELDTPRILEIVDHAEKVTEYLQAAEDVMIVPFAQLVRGIREDIQPFALSRDQAQSDVREFLRKQIALMRWLVEHGRYDTASLLAREWGVSQYMLQKAFPIAEIFLEERRRQASNKMHQSLDNSGEEWMRVWKQIARIRNELAHAGWAQDEPTSQQPTMELRDNLKTLVEQLCRWGARL